MQLFLTRLDFHNTLKTTQNPSNGLRFTSTYLFYMKLSFDYVIVAGGRMQLFSERKLNVL